MVYSLGWSARESSNIRVSVTAAIGCPRGSAIRVPPIVVHFAVQVQSLLRTVLAPLDGAIAGKRPSI